MQRSNQDAYDDRITLALLSALESGQKVTQRSIAGEINIALGLTNAYLKKCVKKGFVKIKQAPRNRYAYYLTAKGFAEKSRLVGEFLRQSMEYFRQARADADALMEVCKANGWKKIALVGCSDIAEVAVLSALEANLQVVAVVGTEGEESETFVGFPVVSDFEGLDAECLIVCSQTEPEKVIAWLRARVPDERVLVPNGIKQFLPVGNNRPVVTEGERT